MYNVHIAINIKHRSLHPPTFSFSQLIPRAGSGLFISQRYGSGNPDSDPYQNVTDLKHFREQLPSLYTYRARYK